MAKAIFERPVLDQDGNIVIGAEYEVKDEGTGLDLAPIYSDRAGTVTLTPPYFSDSDGLIRFYVDPGSTFRVEVVGGTGAGTSRYNEARLFGIDDGETPKNSEAAQIRVTSIASVAGLAGLVGSVDGQQIFVNDYQAATEGAGFRAAWRSTVARSEHDGVQYHSPDRDRGTETQIAYNAAITNTTLGVWENLESVLDSKMSGANAGGDVTVPLQKWFDQLNARGGGTAFFKAGEYDASQLVLTYNTGATDIRIDGDGPESVTLLSNSAGLYSLIIDGATGTNFSNSQIGNFSVFSSPACHGIEVRDLAYSHLQNITITGGDKGMSMQSCLSGQLENCAFVDCVTGLENFIGTGFSGHNAMSYVNCDFTSNSWRGISGGPVDVLRISNGQVQVNGATGDATSGGIALSFDSQINECGLMMDSMYFELNTGGFDVSLVNTGPAIPAHTLTNCQFFKASNVDFTTNNIVTTGSHRLTLINCTFGHFGTYTPDAARKYLNLSADTELVCINCNFQDDLERGDVTNTPASNQKLILVDEKASGTTAGASIVGYQDRVFATTKQNTIAGTTVGTDNFTLPPGVYEFDISAPCHAVNQSQLALYNGTGFQNPGVSEYAVNNGMAMINDVISVASSTNFKVSHYCGVAIADGLGKACTTGQVETYATVIITKIAEY